MRELAARFAWLAQRLAVFGAATAEPARRRVLASARNFILNQEEKALDVLEELKRKKEEIELLRLTT
jgi:hypothetical protein